MSIVEIICFLVIGYVLGNLHTIWKLRKLITSVAKDQGIKLDKTETKTVAYDVYKLEIETVGDTLYLYDTETKDFVCQGSSLSELANLSKTYKNIMVATVAHDDKVFMFINGNYKEFKA